MEHSHSVNAHKTSSIQLKIGLIMILLTTLGLSGFGLYQYTTRRTREMARLDAFAENVSKQLAINLFSPIWNFDTNEVHRVVEAEMQERNIQAILVRDMDEQLLVGKTRDENWEIVDTTEDVTTETSFARADITRADETTGSVEVYMTARFIQQDLRQAIWEIAFIALVLDIVLFVMLIISVRIMLIQPLSRLLRIATAMANGDFRHTLEVNQRDEIGTLARAFQGMKDSISKVINQVQTAAKEVTLGSQQLQDNAASMSQGGTQQAASTEEVSSAMEEMMANITQNADNAKQTEKIAFKAAKDAEESGTAVTKAVQAMQQIAQKITIIEEIASRTNILSMNATIEAAKAQEYGKGFAVVASEVRTLAKQTRDAAKDINSLTTSTVTLSETAGNLLQRLVPDIQHTAELIQEISAASQEQRMGATQINQAMQQLDNVSQQYAGTADEMAATAEELANQAKQLQQTITFFKLPEAPHPAKADNWKPLLESIQTISDSKAREQMLTVLAQMLSVPQTASEPEEPDSEKVQDEEQAESDKEEGKGSGSGYGLNMKEGNKEDNLDEMFEKF